VASLLYEIGCVSSIRADKNLFWSRVILLLYLHNQRRKMLKLRPLSWVIIAINLLFLYATFSGLSETSKSCTGLTGDDLSICQAGTAIGAGLGLGIILFFWVMIDLILLIIWFVSNKNQRECPKCGRKIKRGLTTCPKCKHKF
jgi:hypothetical protein